MDLTKEYVLLSNLINKLDGNEYYLTYAKSLALTEIRCRPVPIGSELIKEMFFYFIETNELKAFQKNEDRLEEISTTNNFKEMNLIEDELYIKIKDLKKLYANKCMVFPSSILK